MHLRAQNSDQSALRELSSPAVLEPDLHARLGQADLHGDLLAHEDVRVARLHEQRLEHVELRACERRALAPLLLPHAAAHCARREMESRVTRCLSRRDARTTHTLHAGASRCLSFTQVMASLAKRPRHPSTRKLYHFVHAQNLICTSFNIYSEMTAVSN